jgi:acyl-CoA hydrolase
MADFKSGPRAHLDEWVAPDIADELGFLRAGKILEWMDVVGVLAATRHCRRPVVTASVDGMELRQPIKVGERVTMTAEVGYTSSRSIGVAVSMTHGLPTAGTARESVAGYMTFVAVDEAGKPAAVPQLHPETAEQIARFDEGRLRREFRSKLENGQLRGPPRGTGSAENTLLIREFLKLLPALRLPWERPEKPRQRHLSYVHKIEPIRSSRLNFHGTLYGGTLMRWIETSANLSARAWLGGEPVRLAGLHGMNFLRPVTQHVFVHIRSVVAHTTPDSLTVLVNVHAENPLSDGQEETLRAFLTYAPAREAVRVAPLQCDGEEERTLFEEVEHRLALHRTLASAA